MLHLLTRRNLGRLGFFYDYDDLLNHARLALWRAHQTFDPGAGTNFQTYLWACITHAFNALHKGVSTKGRRDRIKSFSLESEMEDSHFQLPSSSRTAEACMMDVEESVAVRDAIQALDPRDRHVLISRLYEDRTLIDIGAEMGVCRERIRQIEKKALTQIEFSLRRRFPGSKKASKLSLNIPKGRRPAA